MLARRLDLGDMSERELARRAGLAQATVNHLVTGRRETCRTETALMIELVLGMPVGALFVPETSAEQAMVEGFRRCGGPATSGRRT